VGLFAAGITPEQKRVRLFVLEGLTARPAAQFAEFESWTGENTAKAQASERIDALRARLVEALSRPDLSSAEVAQTRQARNFQETVQTAGSNQQGAASSTTDAPVVAVASLAPERIVFGTQVLSAGAQKGWDFDVFWCGNAVPATAALNYREALAMARYLTTLDRIDTAGGSQPRGRVRLAMLPPSRQGGNYPRTGNGRELRPDGGSGAAQLAEQEIAVQLSQQFGAKQLPVRIVQNNSPRPSSWYISLFACSGPLDQAVPRSNSETL
jgi:hypothetical protein